MAFDCNYAYVLSATTTTPVEDASDEDLKVLIMDPKKQEALVVADGDNFSLAIGKRGMNSRLASRLTKFKIDVKSQKEASEMGISIK